jgi:hypothetical protein
MPSNEKLKQQARDKARSILSKSQSFPAMARSEQLQVYRDLVAEQYQNIARQSGLSTGLTAADLLREKKNARIEQAGGLLSDAVHDVDFPGFVRDLLTGVFDANLDANERQMEAYRKLLKEATREVASFVNDIDDESAMYRLVQDDNQLQVSFPDSGFSDDNASAQDLPVVTDKDGQEIPSNDIKAKILDTKLAMARERRTLLRETLLMGISRLVVEKGTIRASVEFRINAAEKTQTNQQAKDILQKSTNSALGFPAFLGSSTIRKASKISIAASNSQTSTDLSNTLKGSVEIQFKSDYFKLDNFTQIFDLGNRQVPQGGTTPSQQQSPAEGQ